MNNNIILEYINFVKTSILKFYQIILEEDYDKNLIEPLLDRYLMVRYYGETNYTKEKDLVEILGKELKMAMESKLNKENEEKFKNIYALFVYIFYFDDCYYVENNASLLDCFFQDENIKIVFNKEKKKVTQDFLRKFSINKERFRLLFRSTQFSLDEKRLKSNLYKIRLTQNVRISNLYSDYAVEKAFNTGVVAEDKLFITFLMISEIILANAVGLDFSRYYLTDFVPSFFTKEKKIERIFNVIDNNLTKKYLIINIKYSDYLLYKDKIEIYIKRGFSFSVTLDHTFDEDFANLILFTCVLINSNDENYDFVMTNKTQISSTIVVL